MVHLHHNKNKIGRNWMDHKGIGRALRDPTRRHFIRAATVSAGGILAAPFVLRRALGDVPAHVLKMTMADVRTHPIYPVLNQFAAEVLRRTNGAVEIKVYGTGELGSEANGLTGIQTGITDLVCTTTGFLETIYPQVAVLDLPYLFRTSAEAEAVLDGPVGTQLFSLFPARGIYGLSWGHWGWRALNHVSKSVPEPADIVGTKIRVQPGAIYAATYKTLHATPVVIDLSEAYLALSEHAVDAVELPLISLVAGKFYEVAPHASLTDFVYNAGAILAGKRSLDRLEASYQTAIREAALGISPVWRTTVQQSTQEAIALIKTKGCTVVNVDRVAYAQALHPVYTAFGPIVGEDRLREIRSQIGAG
jgi:tripartite ATP-independent transporter DctP family solute receptor